MLVGETWITFGFTHVAEKKDLIVQRTNGVEGDRFGQELCRVRAPPPHTLQKKVKGPTQVQGHHMIRSPGGMRGKCFQSFLVL